MLGLLETLNPPIKVCPEQPQLRPLDWFGRPLYVVKKQAVGRSRKFTSVLTDNLVQHISSMQHSCFCPKTMKSGSKRHTVVLDEMFLH